MLKSSHNIAIYVLSTLSSLKSVLHTIFSNTYFRIILSFLRFGKFGSKNTFATALNLDVWRYTAIEQNANHSKQPETSVRYLNARNEISRSDRRLFCQPCRSLGNPPVIADFTILDSSNLYDCRDWAQYTEEIRSLKHH